MFNQVFVKAMETKCAPLYACLTIGYQEETKPFPQDLPHYFSVKEFQLIKEVFKRNMDGGFVFSTKHLDFKYFSTYLSNLHRAIKYTLKRQN